MMQQHPTRCKRVALLALACLGHLLMIDQVRGAGSETTTTTVEVDQYLNKFMTNLASETLKGPDGDLSEQVDALAKRLDEDMNENPKLLDSLSDALNIKEIASEPSTEIHGRRRRKRSLADLLGGGPASAPSKFSPSRFSPPRFDPSKFNPHIVHAQRRADPEKIRAQAKNDFARLSWFAQNDCLRAAEELMDSAEPQSSPNNNRGVDVVRRSARALARVVSAVANYGLAIFDYVYASPEFFDRIPYVGAQVRQLRDKGEPIYRMVEVVRHTVTYLKLMHAGPQRVTRANGGDDEESQQVVSMNEAERQRKMRELKKVISQVGIVAVKSIGRRLIEHTLASARTESDRPYEETDSRVFYLLVATVMGRK